MGREAEIGLADLWRILRRRVWIIAATFLLAIGLTALYTFTRTPVWEASTLIRVESERSALFEDQALLSPAPDNIETEMRIVTTWPILEQVVDDLDLHVRVVEPQGVPRELLFSSLSFGDDTPFARYEVVRAQESYRLRALAPDTIQVERDFRAGQAVEVPGGSFALASAERMAEARLEPPQRILISTRPVDEAVVRLRQRLEVDRPQPRAELFRISFRGTDRRLVRDVVNGVAEGFLARRQTVHSAEARSAVSFLEEQTAQVEAQLEAAETALQEFREEEQVVALDAEAQEQVQQLADLQAQRSQLAAERDALSNLLRAIEAPQGEGRPDTRSLVAFPTFLRNQTVGSLVESLVEAERRRTELRQRWSPSHPGIVALDSTIRELESRLGEIGRNYLRSLNDQIASLDAVLARFGSDLERVPGRELQFARLERRVDVLADLHSFLEQRLKEAEITEAVSDPSVRVVEEAVLPREPVSPKPTRNLALAGFLGLMLGLGLAFVREATDDRIHRDDKVDEVLGAPVLGRVPSVREGAAYRLAPPGTLVTAGDGHSPPAEAFRSLRTNVLYAAGGGRRRELVLTSPGTLEGTSIVAANLAATFAQQGRKTLLVDADMRRSAQHVIFGSSRSPGLSDLLLGEASLDGVARETRVPDLELVPAGITPPNPSELLGGERMQAFLEAARAGYEVIVLDSPPALAVTDAAVVASLVDRALLVVRAEHTRRNAALEALERLHRVSGGQVGIVVNDAKTDGRYRDVYGSQAEERAPAGDGLRRLLPFGGG